MITECDLVDAFVKRHKADLCFSCKQAQWFISTPEGWIRDDTNAALDLARQFCRKVSAGSDKQRIWLGSYTTIRDVLWLAGPLLEGDGRGYNGRGSKSRRTMRH